MSGQCHKALLHTTLLCTTVNSYLKALFVTTNVCQETKIVSCMGPLSYIIMLCYLAYYSVQLDSFVKDYSYYNSSSVCVCKTIAVD